MENLVLPILMVVVLAIGAVMNYVDGKPERKERVLKVVGKALALIVATVAISILFGGVLYGAFAEEEIPWQHAEANGSIEVTFDGETVYLVVFTTKDGEVLSYFDDAEVVKGTHLRVKISPYGETLDAEVEEPEPIWFPPVLLLGAVAPIVKQNKKSIVRIQKMPVEKEKGRTKQDFRLPVPLESRQTTFVYYEGLFRRSVAVDTVDKGLQLIKRATDKNYAAYLCAFVPAYNQQAVVATNWLGDLNYWFKTSIYFRVEDAYKLLCAKDDVKTVLKVKYSQNGKKLYHFYPLGDIEIGKFVNVEKIDSFGEKKYKNVQVVDVCKMTKETIEDLERRENMKIKTIYCKHAIDLPECWADWGGSDPRLTNEEPQDYDFEEDFYTPSEEEIADFQAMREAYGYRLP